jgi:hypothetical protein
MERDGTVYGISPSVFSLFLFLFMKERLAVENGREKMLKVPCAESGDLGRSTKGASRVELGVEKPGAASGEERRGEMEYDSGG